MPSADLEVRLGPATSILIPGGELEELASRSSGPGGQHVNKVSSRVTLRWNALASEALTDAQLDRVKRGLRSRLTRTGLLVVHAQQHRSRTRNRELARERLAELMEDALAQRRPRRATRPSRASTRRVCDAKRQRSTLKRTRSRVDPSQHD
jgi:ribosome-associated protein